MSTYFQFLKKECYVCEYDNVFVTGSVFHISSDCYGPFENESLVKNYVSKFPEKFSKNSKYISLFKSYPLWIKKTILYYEFNDNNKITNVD